MRSIEMEFLGVRVTVTIEGLTPEMVQRIQMFPEMGCQLAAGVRTVATNDIGRLAAKQLKHELLREVA